MNKMFKNFDKIKFKLDNSLWQEHPFIQKRWKEADKMGFIDFMNNFIEIKIQQGKSSYKEPEGHGQSHIESMEDVPYQRSVTGTGNPLG